jgi:phosphosulfolactate phosphohydrolase-like enzyme
MHGDMGRWMSATAEIAATAEDAENAGFITRMLKGSGNIEQIATQAVLAKKQIEKQRYQLMVHVRHALWDENLGRHIESRRATPQGQSQGSRRTA